MRKPFLIAQREIVEQVKTKGFWIGILLFPIIIVLAIGAPIYIERAKSVRTFAVRDSSGWLAEAVARESRASDTRRLLLEAQRRQLQNDDLETLPPVLRALAPVVAKLPPSQLDSASRALAFGDGTSLSNLSDPNRATILAVQQEYRAWFDTASAGTIRAISTGPSRAKYARVPATGDLNRRVADGELFAYLEIGRDPVKDNSGMVYVSRNLTDDDLKNWYEAQATELVRQRRLAQEGITSQTAAWLGTSTEFTERTVSESGEQAAVGMRDRLRQNAPMVFVYILWISIFSITQGLLMSTIEEKSTRISEVLLSSVSPVQLMAGKIMGVAGTGLMMILTWVLTALVATKYVPAMLGAPAGQSDFSALLTDPLLLTSFVIYFLLGYLLYSAILIGIGSVVNTIQEAQALMMPIMMMLMLPLFAMVPIGRDPNSTFAKVMSYIPTFTPFVMMNRAAAPPSLFEYVATTLLLLAAIALTLWASAKIFRIGILMTGKPPKIGEIVRWVRTPAGVVPGRREL
ncbi:MAG: ABC transporter permease [Gemmatimonadaceae bacterium]